MKPTGKSTTRTGRARRTARALFVMLLLMPITAWGQTLVADDPAVSPDGRTPVVLVHGSCMGRETWTHEAGLAAFLRSNVSFADGFKLYRFEYPVAGVPAGDPSALCGEGGDALTAERISDLAAALQEGLAAEPGIGPDREIALVAHSSGGLVARAFLQAPGQADRTRVAITLATPHHGAPRAKEADAAAGQPGQHAALYWDGYDGADPGDNAWLRCLNGIDAGSAACDAGAAERLGAAVERLVAIGLVLPDSLGEDRPDDGLVPIDSALFEGAGTPVRRQYAGLGGQQGGSACWGDRKSVV